MVLDRLPGNEEMKKQLQKSISSGNLSHAYVIQGAAGSGKDILAQIMSMAFLCTGEPKPCGVCKNCRKIDRHVHPDVKVITAQEGKDQITVDVIRALRADAYVMANEAEGKVYLIEDAQNMNVAAQNALLNILEEPPAGVRFLLLATTLEAFLPTILSRTAKLTLGPVSAKRQRQRLQEKCPQADSDQIERAMAFSGGNTEMSEALRAESGSGGMEEITDEFLAKLCQGRERDFLAVSKPVEKNKARFDLLCESLILALRDLAVYEKTQRADLLVAGVKPARIKQAAPVLSGAKAAKLIEIIEQARYIQTKNANFALNVTDMLVQCWEVIHD